MRLARIGVAVLLLATLVYNVGGFGRADEGVVSFTQNPEESGRIEQTRDTLSVSASASPSGMVTPGETQIYLTMVNSATDPVSDVCVLNEKGELLADIGTLSGSDRSSYVFEQALTPTSAQLRAGGIKYRVRYTLGKETGSPIEREVEVQALVTRLQAEPSLDFTRSLSASYAKSGEEVSITYRLKNTGNVTLTRLAVKDALCGEVGRLETLAPGEKHTFTRAVIMSETCDSVPGVSYSHAATQKTQSKALEALTIYRADELLEATLEADKSAVSPDEAVTLRLVLTNKGNISYDDLQISDQTLGALGFVSAVLKPGDQYVFTKHVKLKDTTTFRFDVSGFSGGGSSVSTGSNMLTIAVMPAIDSVRLSLAVSADQEALNAPGSVTFTLSVVNEGQMGVRDVRLSELTHGEIRTLAVVPTGETLVEQAYDVTQSGDYLFMAELQDAEGGQMIVRSDPIGIRIQPEGADPAPSDPASAADPEISGASYQVNVAGTTFGRMAGVVGCVLVMLFLAVMIRPIYKKVRNHKRAGRQLQKLGRARRKKTCPEETRDFGTEFNEDTGVYRISKNKARQG